MMSTEYSPLGWKCPHCCRGYAQFKDLIFLRGSCNHDICRECIMQFVVVHKQKLTNGAANKEGYTEVPCPLDGCRLGKFCIEGVDTSLSTPERPTSNSNIYCKTAVKREVKEVPTPPIKASAKGNACAVSVKKEKLPDEILSRNFTTQVIGSDNEKAVNTKSHRNIVTPSKKKWGLKPLFEEGEEVFARWHEDKLWYSGTVKSHKTMKNNGTYGPTRRYSVIFDDGDEADDIEDHFLMAKKDYELKNMDGKWIGVKNIQRKCSKDEWAKSIGWYEADISFGWQPFSRLMNAVKAYDDHVLMLKGKQAQRSDLNMPESYPDRFAAKVKSETPGNSTARVRPECNDNYKDDDESSRFSEGDDDDNDPPSTKRRRLSHETIEEISVNAIRQSKLITREKLHYLSGGSKGGCKNPLKVGTPILDCGARAIATKNKRAHHICIKEKSNHPLPLSVDEEFVLYRIAPKSGQGIHRDVQVLMDSELTHPPIPIFWEPEDQSDTTADGVKKKVRYVGHWKVTRIDDHAKNPIEYKGKDRNAVIHLKFAHFNERWERIIDTCHHKSTEH
mmetsp:Transcript_22598/g.47626  ORF Transcript_22598/g.47626 Transcript_22598/m.47626 type:complete len:560 (-) Transcript_22598:1859-3538(-)